MNEARQASDKPTTKSFFIYPSPFPAALWAILEADEIGVVQISETLGRYKDSCGAAELKCVPEMIQGPEDHRILIPASASMTQATQGFSCLQPHFDVSRL